MNWKTLILGTCVILCLFGLVFAVEKIVANCNSHNYVLTYLPDDQVKIEITARRGSDEYITALCNAIGEIRKREGRKVDFFMSNEITVVLEPKPSASSNGGT